MYSTTQLALSDWIAMRCTDIAVMYLCERRNMPAPQSAGRKYEKAIEDLEAVRTGTWVIPDCAMRKSAGPVLSNQHGAVFPFPNVVTTPRDTTGDQSGYTTNNDPTDVVPIP